MLHIAPDNLAAIVKKGGFVHNLTKGRCVLLPTGFLYVIAADNECVGLRWSVSSDVADTNRARRHLSELIEDFQEMQNPSVGYGQYLEFSMAE